MPKVFDKSPCLYWIARTVCFWLVAGFAADLVFALCTSITLQSVYVGPITVSTALSFANAFLCALILLPIMLWMFIKRAPERWRTAKHSLWALCASLIIIATSTYVVNHALKDMKQTELFRFGAPPNGQPTCTPIPIIESVTNRLRQLGSVGTEAGNTYALKAMRAG